jgi:hypothetical protein
MKNSTKAKTTFFIKTPLRHLPASSILKSAMRSFHWVIFAFFIDDGLRTG